MTPLNATFDPFVGTHWQQIICLRGLLLMTWNFFDNACTKIQSLTFKNSKMDKISLEYWYNSVSESMEEDFFHQKPILKKGSPDQRSRCCTCAEACHSPFKYDCTSKDQPHQILRHLKHILKVFFFKMYVQKCIVMRFLHLKVAVHSLKLGCGSLFIGMLFKTCCRYKAQIWHRKNMLISHDIF